MKRALEVAAAVGAILLVAVGGLLYAALSSFKLDR